MEVLFLIVAIMGVLISVLVYKNKKYKNTSYYQITKNPYSYVKNDIGKYGEYLTYIHLQNFEREGGKFLFNIYIPKTRNETTEIDLLLICSKGLFVFESKNYSGWIFGNEIHKYWTQTLPQGWEGCSHKERFYNPIMQNASHIKHLKRLVGENVPMQSIIVFSDRCTLKDITITSENISVINRYNVASTVAQICNGTEDDFLTQKQIIEIYNHLYPYTQADFRAKEQHTIDIQRYR